MRRLRSPPLFIIFSLLLPLAFCNSDFLIRTARDGINGHDVGVNIEWLTDAQLSELSEVEGQETRMEKLRQFFDAMGPGTARTEAAAKIWVDCYEWLKDVATEEEQNELKQLHHTDHSKCKQKVAELLDRLEPEKKATIQGRMPFCEHVWYSSHKKHGNEGSSSSSQQQEGEAETNDGEHQGHHHHQRQKKKRWVHRHRRDHHEGHEGHEAHHGGHTLDDYFKTHLSWLSDAQKEELKTLKAEGKSRSDLQEKVMEWLGQMEGEQKEKATEALRGGCRELIKAIFGEEKAGEIRKMKEAGTEPEKMNAKIQEWIAELEDGHKKQMATEYGPTCRKLFGVKSAGRRRRDHNEGQEGHEAHHGGHTLDDYFKTHLSWLSDAQKAELKTLKAEGKSRSDLQQKVMDWIGQMEGDEKEKATEALRGGCRELLKAIFGEEKAGEIRKMKEAGTATEKMDDKIKEWIAQLEDGHKKQMAVEYGPTCRKLFGVKPIGRRRRDQHEGHEGHEGHHGQHSLADYFRTHLAWLSDPQKEELKAAKEGGKSRAELQQKVMGWFDAAEGETKQRAVELLQGGCRELLKLVLGEEKALKLKEMRESGTPIAKLRQQIDEWVSALSDEHKKAIAVEYGPICAKVFEAGKAQQQQRRRRDHHEGQEGHEAHHGGHTLDDYFKTHLSWLSDAQKAELKTLKAEGKSRSDLQQKVMDWIGQMEGDEKEKATEALRGGCRELIKAIFGEEKAGEIRKMKEAGTEPEKMNAKIQEWIAGLEDGHKKQMAIEYGPTCRKLFGVKSAQRRMRRSRHGHRHRPREEEDYGESYGNSQSDSGRDDEVQLEDNGRGYENGEGGDNEELGHEHLDRHRSWLNGRQKKLLKGMRARGHASHELHDKIHQFYEVSPDEVKATARGILQRGCEAILKRLFGDYKAEEIIQAREEGASNAEMDEKIDEALAQIRNPAKRDEAGRFAMTCRRIFSMIERRRREVAPTEKTLDELFKSHLSWLTPAQKEELKQLQEQGTGRSEMQQKIMGWFAELQGQSRDQALEHLRDGCREVLVNVLGQQNADELKRMKEEGITGEQLEAKADEMVGALDDDQKKAKAKQFGPACKQIFMMAAAESRSGRDVQSDEEN